jgi:hypothetical protein
MLMICQEYVVLRDLPCHLDLCITHVQFSYFNSYVAKYYRQIISIKVYKFSFISRFVPLIQLIYILQSKPSTKTRVVGTPWCLHPTKTKQKTKNKQNERTYDSSTRGIIWSGSILYLSKLCFSLQADHQHQSLQIFFYFTVCSTYSAYLHSSI